MQALSEGSAGKRLGWSFCHLRMQEECFPVAPAENPGHAGLSDIPLLPHRLLHDLPGRVMSALTAAGVQPLPQRPAPSPTAGAAALATLRE